VLHCPHCHGSLLFRQWSAEVTLFLHTAPEPTEEQWEELAARDPFSAAAEARNCVLVLGGRRHGITP
jgi:hypothetical protein